MYGKGSPLFPYMGGNEPFQHLDKYGMEEVWDFFMLPYNIFMFAKPDAHVFQGNAVDASWLRCYFGCTTKKEFFCFWGLFFGLTDYSG